jgi:signal transduction histidine kinase/CheY-like chemotaxis protein
MDKQPHDFPLEGYKILAENVPGLEMLLVDGQENIICRVGSESYRQGWIRHGYEETRLQKHYPQEINDLLKPLLKIAFESTPVSREFILGKNYYALRLIPLGEGTSVHSCVIILQNITETKLVENKLILSKKEAEKANVAKDDFIAKMSHEIRTPLNAIVGFSEQLRKTHLNQKQSDFLDVVYNSSQHLLSIIDDILVLSKIESGEIDLDQAAFRMRQVLQSVHDLLELKYRKKKLKFRTLCDLSVEDVLVGDPDKLRQVLINLVNNAIKFTPEGSITLNCQLENDSTLSQTIRFEITDTGIGIPPEEHQRIFEPFHQVDHSMGRNYSGTGLGLTISKDLIDSMGGYLGVKSVPGKGSTFYFTVTFAKQPAGMPDPESEEPQVLAGQTLNHLNILFVDDDPVNRMLGKVILDQLEANTVFAASGEEAISRFRPGAFHLVLLDINMPGVNGVEVARHIRKLEAATASGSLTSIVAMTANVLKKHVDRYLQAGMDDVILKPFTEETLYKKILKFTASAEHPPKDPVAGTSGEVSGQEFSLEQLMRYTRGDAEYTLLMLDTFIENGNELLQKIENAYQENDYAAIAEATHRLLPSVEQMGLEKAASLLRKIDRRYLNQEVFREAPQLVEAAIQELEKGIETVDAARRKLKDDQS